MTIEELRKRRDEILAEMQAIHKLSEDASGELDAEQSAKFDELDAEQKTVHANIKRLAAMDAAEASTHEVLPRLSSPNSGAALAMTDFIGTDDPIADTRTTNGNPVAIVEQGGFHVQHTIPAAVSRHAGMLKAYTGPNGAADAYGAGMWLQARFFGNERAAKYCESHGIEIGAALSEGVNSAGGVFVPDVMSSRIINLKEQYGVFRQNTFVQTMSSDTELVPRRSGGVTAYAIGENTAITASDPAWNNVELVARKWGCLTKISSELSEDSVISMADRVTDEFAYAFAQKEDDSGFKGDGTSTYHGVNGCITAMGSASKFEAGSSDLKFADFVVADFESVMAKLPQFAVVGGNAKWYISSTGFAIAMQGILDAAGGNTATDLMNGVEKRFLGYPVVITQSLHNTTSDVASTVVVLFGDLRMATTMGDRRSFRLKVSEDRYMELDQIGIMATTRFDIVCHDVGDGSNAGPLVGLVTPAS